MCFIDDVISLNKRCFEFLIWILNMYYRTMFRDINLEFITYFSLTLGFLLDHITTIIGVNYYQLHETNLIVRTLMDLGLWGLVDLVIFFSLILLIKISIDKYKSLKFILFLPLVVGILRLIIGFSNLCLLL